MLFQQRTAGELPRANRHVEVVHRSGAIEDLHVSVGQARADQLGERCIIDHERKRGGAVIASANPRAALKVSGSRCAFWTSAYVTPRARTMPATPIITAGTPDARTGPIRIWNVRWTRATPRKNVRKPSTLLLMGGLLYGA